MAPQFKLNRYFQTAVADPARKEALPQQRVYRSASSSATPPPSVPGTMTVVVSSDAASRRTWTLPKWLLALHSAYFSAVISEDAEKKEVQITDLAPRDFQNFVDYMHSSIYSHNTQVADYRAITSHASACLLGEKLGAKPYRDAAMRQLYVLFEPLARLRTSSARKSPIRASDVDYICRATSATTSIAPSVSGVRQLFFDAVASHWTQSDVFNVGDARMESPGDTVSWADVYNRHTDFRICLATSLQVADVWRAALLRPVEDYLDPKPKDVAVKKEEEEEGSDVAGQLRGATAAWGERSSVVARPRVRVPSLRRNASERRRRERAETPDPESSQGWRENRWRLVDEVVAGDEKTEAEAEAGEQMMVDAAAGRVA